MGLLDKIILLFAAIIIIILLLTKILVGILGTVALILALIFIVTSVVSFWPLFFTGSGQRKKENEIGNTENIKTIKKEEKV